MVDVGDDSDVANRWNAIVHGGDPRPYRWGKETSSLNGSVRRTQRQARPGRAIFFSKSAENVKNQFTPKMF
jgi:hypothetical protein